LGEPAILGVQGEFLFVGGIRLHGFDLRDEALVEEELTNVRCVIDVAVDSGGAFDIEQIGGVRVVCQDMDVVCTAYAHG
jgi:hypothetical protein